MNTRVFGKTDMRVTPLAYGAMELRLLQDPREAEAILHTVLDSGINFLDTSQDYGRSEELIGSYISDRRGEFLLATKCGCDLSGGPHVFTPAHILGNLEDSLRKLRTDCIDLWQLHCVVPADLPGGAADEVVQTMREAQRSGKVRYIGVSFKNGKETDPFYPTENQESFAEEMSAWKVFDSIQMVYGPLTRTSEQRMIRMKRDGTGIIARGVVKKYFAYYDSLAEKAGLRDFLEEGESLASLFIRFAMAQPFVDTMIVGSKTPAHIAENAKAALRGPLREETVQSMLCRLDSIGVSPAGRQA